MGTNGLHGANMHLASSPSINGSLHKQPIELIFEILSPSLFPFYHRPRSYNKIYTTSISVNQSFSTIFQNPLAYRHSTGSSNSSIGAGTSSTGRFLQERQRTALQKENPGFSSKIKLKMRWDREKFSVHDLFE